MVRGRARALRRVTILLLRDYRVLERYRYMIAAGSLVLLLLPRLPGIGAQVNGAYLGIDFGPLTFQPAEFAKLGIIIFLASYLRDTRQLLVARKRRTAADPAAQALRPAAGGLGTGDADAGRHPRPRQLADVLRRVPGAALRRHGPRWRSPIAGFGLFALGAWFFANTVGHVQSRVDIWHHPFDPQLYDQVGGSFQIAQSLFAQADGGVWGQGFGQAPAQASAMDHDRCPAAQTDLIYAVIVNEAGLFGAAALLLVYLLFVERGFRDRGPRADGFSKLLAAGLTSVFALQVFVIVGGVTRVIPLTGVTLPFVSYGGSSIVANFVLLALLLIVSDRARREARTRERPDRPRLRSRARAVRGAHRFTSRWTVFEATTSRDNPRNKRPLLEQQQIARGPILAADDPTLARSVRGGRTAPTRASTRRPRCSRTRSATRI